MADQNRAHKRIEKRLTIQYCLVDVLPKKWDMSIIENISAGGVKFRALGGFNLTDKVIQLRIWIPALAPNFLEFEALVLDVQNSSVRAKFLNLSEEIKAKLYIVERMVELQSIEDNLKIKKEKKIE